MSLLQYALSGEGRRIYPQMGALGLFHRKYTVYDLYRDPQKQVQLAQEMDQRFPLDFTYTLDYGVVFLEALGIPLIQPDYEFPFPSEHPVQTIRDLRKLQSPDYRIDGLMSEYLESVSLVSKAIPKPQMVALVGPITLGAELAGIEHFLKSTIRSESYIEQLLDFTEKIILEYCLQVAKNGGKVIQISEPTAGLLSPKMFHKLATDRIKRIFDAVSELGAWTTLHICGKTYNLLEEMEQTGAHGLSLDQIMDLDRVGKQVDPSRVIIGNLDPIDLLCYSSSETVYEETTKLLNQMGHYPNFMISFGCDCLIDTPEENILAMTSAVRNWEKG